MQRVDLAWRRLTPTVPKVLLANIAIHDTHSDLLFVQLPRLRGTAAVCPLLQCHQQVSLWLRPAQSTI